MKDMEPCRETHPPTVLHIEKPGCRVMRNKCLVALNSERPCAHGVRSFVSCPVRAYLLHTPIKIMRTYCCLFYRAEVNITGNVGVGTVWNTLPPAAYTLRSEHNFFPPSSIHWSVIKKDQNKISSRTGSWRVCSFEGIFYGHDFSFQLPLSKKMGRKWVGI